MITPGLTISEQALTFARTVPGKPVFLVLRIAADQQGVQVAASTDLPDVFQLATDNRPIFNPTLVLTPEPAGTYVHIRYMPTRSGVHEATLLLQSPTGSQTVTLTGRSTRLPVVDTRTNKALTRSVSPRQENPTMGRSGALVAGAVVTIALLYAAITYRCQLLPSLCREETSVSQQVVPVPAETTVEAPAAVSIAVPTTRERATPEQTAAASADRRAKATDENTVTPEQVTRRTASTPKDKPEGTEAPAPLVSGRTESRPAAPKTERTIRRPAESVRPAKPATETEESDLERELNGRTN